MSVYDFNIVCEPTVWCRRPPIAKHTDKFDLLTKRCLFHSLPSASMRSEGTVVGSVCVSVCVLYISLLQCLLVSQRI